jgi:Uma2 family endonuclease
MDVGVLLVQQLRDKPCEPFDANQRLTVSATGLRTYPDASVYCEPLACDPEDPENTTLTNPTVVFEVLSPSTQAYDRGLKAENYRRIQTLKGYVLISQDQPRIEIFERHSDGTWPAAPVDVRGMDAAARIECIAVTLPLAEVYRRVTFAPTGA